MKARTAQIQFRPAIQGFATMTAQSISPEEETDRIAELLNAMAQRGDVAGLARIASMASGLIPGAIAAAAE